MDLKKKKKENINPSEKNLIQIQNIKGLLNLGGGAQFITHIHFIGTHWRNTSDITVQNTEETGNTGNTGETGGHWGHCKHWECCELSGHWWHRVHCECRVLTYG